MGYIIEPGKITLHQGDTVPVPVEGLESGVNQKLYAQIRDKNRLPVGQQQFTDTLGQANVTITLPSDLTDLLTVPGEEAYEEYYLSFKTCIDGVENTLFSGGEATFGNKIVLIVYPKEVDGD